MGYPASIPVSREPREAEGWPPAFNRNRGCARQFASHDDGRVAELKREETAWSSDRFDRFLPLAGVLAGLLFGAAFIVDRNHPRAEAGPAQTFCVLAGQPRHPPDRWPPVAALDRVPAAPSSVRG